MTEDTSKPDSHMQKASSAEPKIESVPPSTPASQPSKSPSVFQHAFFKSKRNIAILAVLVIVAGCLLLTREVYKRPVSDGLVRTASNIIPYPALSVDGEKLTLKEFLIEYDALLSYFDDLGEQAPPTEQLEVAIAETLINKIAIAQLAEDYGIELDQEQVDQYYNEVVSAQESEEAFIQNLSDTFNWTAEDFRKRIVESIVLALQMTDAVLEDETLQSARKQMVQDAYDRLQAGEDFAVVAKEVHEPFGGIESDLGFVQASVLPTSWSSQVNALEEGAFTEIIELPEGYAIFKLVEKLPTGEEGQLHLLSITVPKLTLEDVVDEYLETVTVKRYVGEEI